LAQTSVGHVFISYSRTDEAVMHRTATFLRKRGIKVWVDSEKLVPGTPVWEVEIEKAIRGASAVIVLLSPDSKDSEWVRREISLADQNKTRIFPVLVRGDEGETITIRLITRQYVDMRQKEDVGLSTLCTELKQYLKEPEAQDKLKREEDEKLASEKTVKKGLEKIANWVKQHRGLVIILVCIIVVLVSAIWFATGMIRNSLERNLISEAPATLVPTALQPVSDIPILICRPSDNSPPTINLQLAPRSVRIYGTAELTISVSDSENDPYEILKITAEKGRFPNGEEEPYLYEAPGFRGEDIVTVLVRDHDCVSKNEIRITIQQ
jgi:hypothetical protein